MKQYDDRQREVIEATGGYHLVLAAPGCGKTEVLAERIRQAAERGVDYGDMLCLTFTNRAARSMKERIAEMMGAKSNVDVGRLYVGNIHRYCARLLFEKKVVAAGSAIIDEDDSISILADILGEEEEKVAADNRLRHRYSEIVNLSHFMRQYAGDYPRELMVHQDAVDPKVMRALCDIARKPYTRQGIAQLYADIDDFWVQGTKSTERDDLREMVTRMMAAQRYTRYKQQHDLLDFEDLLLAVYELPDNLIDKYHWIQVDEIQDLNPLQLTLIDRFTAKDDFTVMFLGDNQQAIFSFMGAKGIGQSAWSKVQGSGSVHHLYRNYRSPRYLLDVCNEYGQTVLGIDSALLPQSGDDRPHDAEDLQILMSENNIDESRDVARLVGRIARENESETTAVIVSYNAEADSVSDALRREGVNHFKVSGQDLFAETDVKLLMAHLNVVTDDSCFIAWARLFVGLNAISDYAPARAFVRRLKDVGLSPADFLTDDGRTTLKRFADDYDGGDIVVFDTETTGLNIYDDDIVQIAAVRIRNGVVVGDMLNVFLQTERKIPAMLGDIENPLAEEYATHEHLEPEDGLQRFLRFAEGAVLLAHNADFDMHILESNLRRYGMETGKGIMAKPYHDSLRLARLIEPRMKSHRLKDLLEALHLEGQNSHLADDDIMATVSLVRHCRERTTPLLKAQQELMATHARTIRKFRAAYMDIYSHTRQMLYRRFAADEPPALVTEMAYVYHQLLENRFVRKIEKLPHLMAFLAEDVVGKEERSLQEQLQNHLTDINTYKESDLCGSSSMRERVFVSTVHKAKGLEFDNVIVYDCTDGNYPGYFAKQSEQGLNEERRRLYVALSRARRRLFITWCRQRITQYGRVFQSRLSPFTGPIQRFFLMGVG